MQRELGFSARAADRRVLARAARLRGRRHRGRALPRPPQPAGADDGRLDRRRRARLAWSQVDGLLAFYALWVGDRARHGRRALRAGVHGAGKALPAPAERRRAMTAMTLVAALASFIFLPLAQALIDALWLARRAAHPRGHPRRRHRAAARARAARARRARPRTRSVHAVRVRRARRCGPRRSGCCRRVLPRVVRGDRDDRARDPVPARARPQRRVRRLRRRPGRHLADPGRLLFAPLAARLPRPVATAALFALIAAGIAVIVTVARDRGGRRRPGAARDGQRHGHARPRHRDRRPLRRRPPTARSPASRLDDHAARAAGPVAAAVYAAAFGYGALLWTLAAIAMLAALLAFVSERGADHAVA